MRGVRRGLRLGLLGRVSLALALAGLLPLALASTRLIRISEQEVLRQIKITQTLAVRATAAQVASHLSALRTLTETAAHNPMLYQDPRSTAATELLAGLLQAESEVVAVALLAPDGGEVVRAQRRDLAAAAQAVLAVPGTEELAVVAGGDRRWLRLQAPLPGGRGVLRLMSDARPLAEMLQPLEIQEEAHLILASVAGEAVLGSVPSLDPFPELLVANALTARSFGAGEYGEGDHTMVGAYAPVEGSPWVVISQQPASVAYALRARIRQAWNLDLALALILAGVLAAVAYLTVVRPLRQVIRAQRRLAGLSDRPQQSDEIGQLRESFAALERRMKDREAVTRLFLGRYQVREVLGEGAMGTVFRAFDPKLERPVALKTLRFTGHLPSRRGEMLAGLLHEAVISARINHPNIVAVYDLVEAEDVAFIAMEYIDGVTLEGHLWSWGRLGPGETLLVATALARGLAAAHDQGVVHRDVKPGNVLLGFDGAIKLGDFGIAQFMASLLRSSDQVFGTAGFLPPEALRGEAFGAKGDLFALGVTLYRCLAGELPFRGRTTPAIVLSTLNHQPPPLRKVDPAVPRELDQLTMALLEKEPERRTASAEQLLASLEGLATRPWAENAKLDLGKEKRPREMKGEPGHPQVLATVAMESGPDRG